MYTANYNRYLEVIQTAIDKVLPEVNPHVKLVRDAMQYSLQAGGKRIRPVLALATAELLDQPIENVLPYAMAIEMIHTYSLIHDDLPAMDNDDVRRGKPTNHKMFGEAIAILAGDALLNYAFEHMIQHTIRNTENINAKLRAMEEVAKSSGMFGMIGGQVIDMQSEGKMIDKEALHTMHAMKTGALIKAPILVVAQLADVQTSEYQSLKQYAENIGLAFQIKDDILDVESSTDELGKPVGSDMESQKSTFISIYGIQESKKMLAQVSDKALESLQPFGEKAQFLRELTIVLKDRKK